MAGAAGEMSFKRRVIARYQIVAGTDVIAWDFPQRLWRKMKADMAAALKKLDVEPQVLKANEPHVSVSYVIDPTQEEIEKIKLAAPIYQANMKCTGLDVLQGQAQYGVDYLVVKFEVDSNYMKFMKFIDDLVGVERVKKFQEFKPHCSIACFKKDDAEKVKQGLPELEKAAKRLMWKIVPETFSVWRDFKKAEQESARFY